MKKHLSILVLLVVVCAFGRANACTGITLTTKNNEVVAARTIEWAYTEIGSRYTIVPRGYVQRSFVPGGAKEGMEFTARYGYVGLAVEQAEFVVEGVNETGLSAGLFYFPSYGEYLPYDKSKNSSTISDFQLVSWILGNFKSVDEVKQAMKNIRVTAIDPRSSTVHWRVIDPSGKQIVIEIVAQQVKIHDNLVGVLTNSPSFDWHLTNLNNYINLFTGAAPNKTMGSLALSPIGGGSGLLGIPGDMTPPSRFVRAAFFQTAAPKLATTTETVLQAFHILNNFDIPIGIQFTDTESVADIPSATQWTVATDLQNKKIYYRTMFNSEIRYFDLAEIDFSKVKYQSELLDKTKQQPLRKVEIKR